MPLYWVGCCGGSLAEILIEPLNYYKGTLINIRDIVLYRVAGEVSLKCYMMLTKGFARKVNGRVQNCLQK